MDQTANIINPDSNMPISTGRPSNTLSTSKPPEQARSFPSSGFTALEADRLVEEEELPDYQAHRFYPVHLGEDGAISNDYWTLFVLTGPDGEHVVLVFEAAQMSLRDMKLVFQPEGFDERLVRGAITELLQALDFLHTHAEAVHTDAKEMTSPVPRKLTATRTIYLSRLMRPKEGPMLLSDFGEARIGPGPHGGDIMPLEYRAPETLLYIGWGYPVDIWSVGLTAWDLLEPKKLFTARDEDGDLYDAAHLAQLIAALGPPPPEFLAKNAERRADFWDEHGNWLGLAPIPHSRTMEALETRLGNKSGFLRFIRRALSWMPEKRATAKELLKDPWLTGEEV
ncbi:kinase-like protein [Aspergillus ellipticus CBS 707.79]|uniref:non-specific serine/threonine protein kinase n=1 Tax=Aspergillus ellipticus CBS 707.79 TaxID=1448320 RepID=A0A319DAB8_9EURO|nr:kinase-like protein [Aspergillus ellipticus CBS 707.79]